MLADVIHNDLQAAALRLRPDLGEVLERGEAAGALASLVSGSGPTLAFLAESKAEARALQQALESAGYAALNVSGPVHGARIV